MSINIYLLAGGKVSFLSRFLLFLLLSLSLVSPEAEATATDPDILSIPVSTRLTWSWVEVTEAIPEVAGAAEANRGEVSSLNNWSAWRKCEFGAWRLIRL